MSISVSQAMLFTSIWVAIHGWLTGINFRADWKSSVSEVQEMFSGRPARLDLRLIRIVEHGTCNNFMLSVTVFPDDITK
jgi:hypothetical protein